MNMQVIASQPKPALPIVVSALIAAMQEPSVAASSKVVPIMG